MCNFKKSKLLCKIEQEKKLNQKHTTTNDKKK